LTLITSTITTVVTAAPTVRTAWPGPGARRTGSGGCSPIVGVAHLATPSPVFTHVTATPLGESFWLPRSAVLRGSWTRREDMSCASPSPERRPVRAGAQAAAQYE
jgi:hypothetical protein